MPTNICIIPSCDRPIYNKTHAVCQLHYGRWITNGSFELKRRPNGAGSLRTDGYITVYVNGRSKLLHRHIMEQHLGRSLTRLEYVHHKDHNKANNQLDNLEVVPASQHTAHHVTKHKNGLRTCTACKAILPAAQFYKMGKYRTGTCIPCNRAYQRNRRLTLSLRRAE